MIEKIAEMLHEPALFVVYIDLNGVSRGAMIKYEFHDDAVNCIHQAWASNLLWHFKIYDDDYCGEDDSVLKYANLSSDLESISKLLSLARMEKHLDRCYKQLEARKVELIKKYGENKDFRFVPSNGDATFYTSLGILRETCTSLRATLSEQSVSIPNKIDDDVAEVFEYVLKVSKAMYNIKHFHTYGDNNHYAVSPSQYTPAQFLNSLPKLESIFPSDRSRKELIKLLTRA